MKQRLTAQAVRHRNIDNKFNRIRACRYNVELEMMSVADPPGRYPIIGQERRLFFIQFAPVLIGFFDF